MNRSEPFHKMSILAISLLLSMHVTGCNAIGDLDKLIEHEQTKLSKLSQELRQEAPPILHATQEIQADLRYRPLNTWLSDVSNPPFTITVIGVRAVGDIVYQPGFGKAWLQPAHDTKARLELSNLELRGDVSGIVWSTKAAAYAEARAYFDVLNIGGNFLCTGNLPVTPVTGSVVLAGITGTTLGYSMRIGAPEGLGVKVACLLGGLGTYKFDIPVGTITDSVSHGTFDLGVSTSGRIVLPEEIGGKSLRYNLRTVNPSVTTSRDSLTVRENVEITID